MKGDLREVHPVRDDRELAAKRSLVYQMPCDRFGHRDRGVGTSAYPTPLDLARVRGVDDDLGACQPRRDPAVQRGYEVRVHNVVAAVPKSLPQPPNSARIEPALHTQCTHTGALPGERI